MAFTSPMTAVTGATFTAAQFNTHVRDNLNAIWVGTTAGDMEYYTSATAKARLAIGVAFQHLRVNSGATAPEWGALVYRRQGAASSAWVGGGSNNYTPDSVLIQIGDIAVASTSVSGSFYTGSASVTFPVGYSAAPLVFTTVRGTGARQVVTEVNQSTSGVTITAVSSVSTTVGVSWLAFGPP